MRKKPPSQARSTRCRLTTTQRGLGWDHQQFRRRVMARYNWICQQCLQRAVVTEATELHHVVPRAVDPTRRLDLENVKPLCRTCHEHIHGQNRNHSDHGP